MFKFLRFVLGFYLGVAVILSVLWLGVWQEKGMRLYNVETNSMGPVMRPGDLVVTAKVDPKNLMLGQIVSYQNPQNTKTVITHRVYKIYPKQSYLVAKGDDLAQPDPPIPYSAITGKTIKIVPKAGYVFDIIHSPAGLIGLVYLPAMLICAYELQRIISLYSYRSYSATRHL